MNRAGISSLSPAANDLGLGADLSQQVKDEGEEERKKRLMAGKVAQLTPGAQSLFGGAMGLNGGGY